MSSKQHVRILYWNADGIRSKLMELLDMVSELSIDIIALSETRLSPSTKLHTPGYTCYRCDKKPDGTGQGVAILIKSDIEHSPINLPTTRNLECSGIQVTLSNQLIAFISAYQSPNLPLLTTDLDKLVNVHAKTIIMGDLNTKHPYWHCSRSNIHGEVLFDHMINNEYDILAPSSPTLVHYHSSYTPSTPDIIIANSVYNLSEPQAISRLSSNHLPVYFTASGKLNRQTRTIYNYKKANWIAYRSYLNESITLSQTTFNSPPEIDLAIKHLTQSIINARDKAIPKLPSEGGHKLPRRVRSQIKHKNRLRKLALNEYDLNKRRQLFSQVNYMQKCIKAQIQIINDDVWNTKLAKVTNPTSDLWRVVKSLNYQPVSIPPLKLINNTTTSSAHEQCEALANSFLENMNLTKHWVSNPSTEEAVKESIRLLDCNEMSDYPKLVRPHEIQKLLRKLKPNKAPGFDGLGNGLLKNLPQKLIVYLTKVFNGCLRIAYFPSTLKHAKIIPIKKPGKDQSIPSSYRPISLLPSIGKLLEAIILSRLIKVTEHKLMPEQFGFRSSHSTTQQLARVAEHIAHGLNGGLSTGMILLDVEKAFDSVWHEGLLHKLIKLEVPQCLVKVIQNYLRDRSFSVYIGKDHSAPKTIPAGVPQGSLVGPYAFILYLNDIPKQPHTHLAIYADDTATFTTHSDIDVVAGRLQYSLELLSSYFKTWKLKLNSAKTEGILFTRKRALPNTPVIIDNFHIRWSVSVKYLGVILDKTLNWNKNTELIISKGVKALNSLKPILNRKSVLSPSTKLLIYSTLVRPCLTYAAPVWSSLTENKYNKIQTIQNKALRLAYNTPFRTNLKRLHKRLKYPFIKEFILKISRKFYLKKNPAHHNILISSIGKTRLSILSYARTYNRYRLPHHYFLRDAS